MEFKNSNKLKGYLKSESEKLSIHSNIIYTLYFIREFLEMLYKNDPENHIIKGSVSQLTSIERLNRPINNINSVTSLPLNQSVSNVMMATKKNDSPIKYKIIQKFLTTNETACLKINCSFDSISHMIKFNLKTTEKDTFVRTKMPLILSKDKLVLINTNTIEQNIANKIYVILKMMTENNEAKKERRGFKDLYDLHSLITFKPYNIELVSYFFKMNVNRYGEFDIKTSIKELSNKNYVTNNKKQYREDKKRFNFLEDIELEGLVLDVNDIVSHIIPRGKRR